MDMISQVDPIRSKGAGALVGLCIGLCVSLSGIFSNEASALLPERRGAQSSTETSWYFLPATYSIPGIGSGFILAGLYNNIGGSHSDALIAATTGDINVTFGGLIDNHLITDTLVVDFAGGAIHQMVATAYNGRGLDTDPKDFSLLVSGEGRMNAAQVNLRFDQRRYQLNVVMGGSTASIAAIKDSEGNLLVNADQSKKVQGQIRTTNGIIDWTDDWQDPRIGIRGSYTKAQTIGADQSGVGPEQYTLDTNLSAFIPIGNSSTWVFNQYRSDAVVTKPGISDRAVLQQLIFGGADCSVLPDPVGCQSAIDKTLDDTVAANTLGTSSSLGGPGRLRGFPLARFKAAHTLFYGTEFRWNLTEENTPFNLWLIKDVRTRLQLAFFYERGSVAEYKKDLSKEFRSSTGAGFRVVTGSGMVWRIDVARGEEGSAVQSLISYPWGEPTF